MKTVIPDTELLAEFKVHVDTTQCSLKAESFGSRQQMRGEEIEALAKAVEIISGKAVSGAADKHLPALVQKHALFLRSSITYSRRQSKAAELLTARAQKFGSKQLMQIATKIGEDPFAKVTQMIRDMIAKLQDEANAEAGHKEWCDGELHDNKLTREEKTAEVNTLTANVDGLNAKIDKLKAGIAQLTQEMTELDAAIMEATNVRSKEKAKNEETIADSTSAIEAVEMATQVLKEFYGKASGATALVQQSPADDAPASWNAPMTGQQGASKGVLGMLEIIHTDFTRLQADTTSEEDQAASEYAEFMETSQKDKELKYADRLAKQRAQTAKEFDLGNVQKDLKATQGELDAAHAYYVQLKPDCIADGLSFEERFQARQQEIESLNEAFKILSGEMDDA